jgi:hypothetical protein
MGSSVQLVSASSSYLDPYWQICIYSTWAAAQARAEPKPAVTGGFGPAWNITTCDIPVDAVLRHITSGGSVPRGYGTDDSGNLLACNEAEEYDQELAASATEGDDAVQIFLETLTIVYMFFHVLPYVTIYLRCIQLCVTVT